MPVIAQRIGVGAKPPAAAASHDSLARGEP
jgi:hypothetical protein